MVESRHSGCANQCSRGRKMADAVLLLLLLCCLPFLSSVSQTNHFPPSVLTFLSLSFSFSFFLLPALSLPCLFLSVSPLFLSKKKTNGLSLSVSLTFSFKKILPALLFFALFSSVFLKLTPLESVVCFSPSPKFPPSFTVVPPLLFISKRRRGSPYPCRGVV